mmetsp:Transcript_2076/g.3172  ORF Transcript_2076/g.3172 Transcript_2076/m.3172 type:complete len:367 (-) Transcript_2076:1357-2457(-)|eukprot:CAMPEP_0184646928 /NCGR_PEP_ID=MMETSP0308-20130426/3744_1 /TAXON_ID=38269 /ORGANISM="Gloeochaete witrockiana, Strain SAG 46.84" /LENGTH=366 /DNA_ID=CAMNT_0027077419 /DNA_START=141 /DNA_END=1241 /DNA_ORIENTATION=-
MRKAGVECEIFSLPLDGGHRVHRNVTSARLRSLFILGCIFAVCLVLVLELDLSWAVLSPTARISGTNGLWEAEWKGEDMDFWGVPGVILEKRRSLSVYELDCSLSAFRRAVGRLFNSSKIPEHFDARERWPGLVDIQPRNQRGCGSCWALQTTDVLSERIAIQTQGRLKPRLSAQMLISCDTTNRGCKGGYIGQAWEWLSTEGAVSERCMPYASTGEYCVQCTSRCAYGTNITLAPRLKAKMHYRVGIDIPSLLFNTGVHAIQEEILTNGPVVGGMYIYEDLFYYKRGIYTHSKGEKGVSHAVKIIGWGTENKVPYWIVQNSWGCFWGDAGYFRIMRGVNECAIESYVYAGIPEDLSEARIQSYQS